MAASSNIDLAQFYKRLGVSTSAGRDEIKQAYLKQVLKWHPQKTKRIGAEKRYKEITEAYEALISPTVHRVQGGKVVCVSLAHIGTFDTTDGYISSFASRINVFSWFRPSSVQEKLNSRLDNAVELLSEYMYDGDLGEYFTDADDALHVIVNIPLARALVGGSVTFKVPTEDGTKTDHTEEIQGILDGYWLPIKKTTVKGRQIWIIFKVTFPKDMTEEEQVELRQKLLLAQTSAAIFPALWGWISSHPKTSALGLVTLVIGGVSVFRRYSWFRLARSWIM